MTMILGKHGPGMDPWKDLKYLLYTYKVLYTHE